MAGTRAGGLAAAKANKENDPDFYKKIGSIGGRKTADSGKLYKVGFASNRELARSAGAKGGRISIRGKAK